MIYAAVYAVEDTKVTAIIEATIIGTGIEMIMEMVSKSGAIIGCDISIVNSVDGISPILLDFMPLGSVILVLLPCLMIMIIGICQVRLLVSQMALEPLRGAERALKPKAIRLFLK